MRCLTIANELHKNGASLLFVCRQLPESLRKIICASGHQIALLPARSGSKPDELDHATWLSATQIDDAYDTLATISEYKPEWIIVDHYALDHRWESQLKKCGSQIFVIDDLADRKHNCDVLLDQNFYLDSLHRYKHLVVKECKLLLGPKYALLRDEFRVARRTIKPKFGDVQRILVFLGGMDAGNYTSNILNVLSEIGIQAHVDIVIGATHPNAEDIVDRCLKLGYFCHVQTNRMAELIASADLAIGAGGSATWERCCLGLPSITISVAKNQERLVSDAAIEGLIYAVDISSNVEQQLKLHLSAFIANNYLRQHLSKKSLTFVDGLGVFRVVSEFGCCSLQMRKANSDDCLDVWNWRNAPENRLVSRNSTFIDLDVHKRWYQGVLNNPNRLLLIGELAGQKIGVVRFDIENREAEVSIYLVPGISGKGLGKRLLLSAEKWLKQSCPDIEIVVAEVLSENPESSRLFLNTGYSQTSIKYKKVMH